MRTLLALLVACPLPCLAVDYQKCSEFINVEPEWGTNRNYQLRNTGPFLLDRLTYVPVQLTPDGEVVCNPYDVTGVTCHRIQEGGATVYSIDFPLPSLSDLHINDVVSILERPDRATKATITITQTATTLEYYEDLNLTDEELQRAVGVLDREDLVPGKVRIVFDIENDECVLREIVEEVTSKQQGDLPAEMVTVDMPLCRDIKAFIENEPAAAVFWSVFQGTDENQAANGVAHVMEPHANRLFSPRDGFQEAFTLDFSSQKVRAHVRAGAYAQSPKFSVFQGLYAYYRFDHAQQSLRGMSPMVSAVIALEHCYSMGLGIWLDE